LFCFCFVSDVRASEIKQIKLYFSFISHVNAASDLRCNQNRQWTWQCTQNW